MQRTASTVLTALAWLAIPGLGHAADPPFELVVNQDRFVGSKAGTLVFTDEAVEFHTPDESDSRRWTYLDLKQVRLLGPAEIVIDTYEDRGRLGFGADRSYEFEIVRGSIGQDLVAFLHARVKRPVVTAVLPPLAGPPLNRLPVKHQRRGHGSEGTLTLYADGLAYTTDQARESRYWRFRDLSSVLQLDRHRLQVSAYQGGSGATRPYVFELKTELSAAMYDALWQRVNRVALAGGCVNPADPRSLVTTRAVNKQGLSLCGPRAAEAV